ncbi:MAG: tetratricopeptide repeat protein [Leptolyngbyaceae cyanobacterium]
MTPELISAIGALWPLALIIATAIILLAYKKSIENLFDRALKLTIKRGESQLDVEMREEKLQEQLNSSQEYRPTLEYKDKSKEAGGSENSGSIGTVKDPENPEDNFWKKVSDELESGSLEKAEELLEKKLIQSEDKTTDKAIFLMQKYFHGYKGVLTELSMLAKTEKSSLASYFLAELYESAGNFKESIEAYKESIRLSESDEVSSSRTVDCSKALLKSGNKSESIKILSDFIDTDCSAECKFNLYVGLAFIYGEENNSLMRSLCLDKALEYQPNDSRTSFQAAYSCDQKQLKSIALIHYLNSVDFDDYSFSWNNMGVLYGEIDAPNLAVNSFKKAYDLDNTLAASNLARRYIDSGFFDEAKEILEKVKQKGEVHKNVYSASSRIISEREEEAVKKDKFLKAGRKQQSFFRKYIESYFSAETSLASKLSGAWRLKWKNTQRQIEIKVDGEKIMAEWQAHNKDYEFSGNISGNTFQMNLKSVISEDDPSYKYNKSPEVKRFFAYLDKGGNSIHLMQKVESLGRDVAEPEFLHLIRRLDG